MRNLIVSFRKIMTSSGFWLCVGMTVLLLFSAEVYTDYDTKSRYSVLRALTSFSPEELSKNYELCNILVAQNARSGWFALFTPITTAFCFVPLMCSESEENAVRFQIFRTTKLKYSVAKFLSGAVSGGIAVMLGYLIFIVPTMLLFPRVSEMSISAAVMLKDTPFNFPKLVIGMWFYGAFWSVPAMFLTSVLRNKYLVMCIPFFAKYGLAQTYQKMLENALFSGDFDEKMIKFANSVNPDGILWISETTRLNVILLFGILTLNFFAAFLIIMQKRSDCGV